MYKGKGGIASKVIMEMEGGNTPEISQVTKPQTTVWAPPIVTGKLVYLV